MTATSTAMDERDPTVDSPKPSTRGDSVGSRVRDVSRRAYTAVQTEALLVAVLVGSFLARWLLADRHSYWLDELVSVTVYGISNDSALEAVQRLAEKSVHPPLYQFMLNNWMDLFGDGERATRSLSNLYITLATLFLYLMMRGAFSRRIALTSAVAFALMYTPTYYGMETRSYAQTILLVAISSYALFRIMRAGTGRGWGPALRSPAALLFTAANIALLFTHYYNFFFWAAQAIMAGLFVLRERSPRDWLAGLGAVAVIYALQAGTFALIWGRFLIDAYRRRGDDFPVNGRVRSPVDLLQTVIEPNLHPPLLLGWLGVVLAGVMAVRTLIVLVRRRTPTVERQQAWTVAYLFGWLLVPLLVVYVVFLATGVARYSSRFWLFVMPPLAPLLVLTLEEAVRLASRVWHRVRETGLHPGWAVAAAIAAIVGLVVPGTLAAADRPKDDYRGAALDVVNLVTSNPESSYVIYEASFRNDPVLNYYLSQYSVDIRATGTITRSEEAQAEDFLFERDVEVIEQHDFLVVVFVHHQTTHFPVALGRLTETYPVYLWQLDERRHGLAIFAVSPAAEATSAESG